MIDIEDLLNYVEQKYNRPTNEDEKNLIKAIANLITTVWQQLDEQYAAKESFESASL